MLSASQHGHGVIFRLPIRVIGVPKTLLQSAKIVGKWWAYVEAIGCIWFSFFMFCYGTLMGFHDYCYNLLTCLIFIAQVVTLSVYSYFIASLLGRQYIMDSSPFSKEHNIRDLYFPFFTMLEFIIYMGWLKVSNAVFFLVSPFTLVANFYFSWCFLICSSRGDIFSNCILCILNSLLKIVKPFLLPVCICLVLGIRRRFKLVQEIN